MAESELKFFLPPSGYINCDWILAGNRWWLHGSLNVAHRMGDESEAIMTTPGEVMLREISEIPRMLGDIAKAMSTNQEANELFTKHNFDSVIILARGTSDNAGHYLKYLLETQLGLPVGLASPSAATMYPTNFKYQNSLNGCKKLGRRGFQPIGQCPIRKCRELC